MKLAYPAIFIPFEDGDDGYTVEFPDLPGCVTEGYSMADALFMAEDAASGWVFNGFYPHAGDAKATKNLVFTGFSEDFP